MLKRVSRLASTAAVIVSLALSAACTREGEEIDKLERTKVEERSYEIFSELSLPLLVGAFALLSLQMLLDYRESYPSLPSSANARRPLSSSSGILSMMSKDTALR